MHYRSQLAGLCEDIMIVEIKPMEIIDFLMKSLQKLWLKIGVGNLMKIFFIRNAPNTIPLSLKVLPVMTVMVFPRKTMNFSCFFSPGCHCGTPYSKSRIPCTRPNTALWHPAARQLPSDGSLRLLGVRSCASRFVISCPNTIIPEKISVPDAFGTATAHFLAV